jgi:hypothetical protein
MATGATFQDSGGTDFIGGQMSIMERAQRMRQSEEVQQMRRQEFDLERQKFAAMLPAIVAKRNADVVSAQASIANAARMENFREKAAASSVDYNQRFQNILTIPDTQDRADTLAAFQSEVAWMDVLPEYKGFVDTVNNSRASTVTMALTNLKLDEALERARVASEGGVARAEIQAGARTANAQTRAASNEKIAAINADTKLTLAEKQGQIAAARQADSLSVLQSRAAEADQQAADAAAAGDDRAAAAHRQAAASYRDAVTKSTTNAGYAPSAPRDASQDPRPTPKSEMPEPAPLDLRGLSSDPAASSPAASVAPTRVDPKATRVSIAGKDYPIFVDKDGNRAYRIEGRFVPINTE